MKGCNSETKCEQTVSSNQIRKLDKRVISNQINSKSYCFPIGMWRVSSQNIWHNDCGALIVFALYLFPLKILFRVHYFHSTLCLIMATRNRKKLLRKWKWDPNCNHVYLLVTGKVLTAWETRKSLGWSTFNELMDWKPIRLVMRCFNDLCTTTTSPQCVGGTKMTLWHSHGALACYIDKMYFFTSN